MGCIGCKGIFETLKQKSHKTLIANILCDFVLIKKVITQLSIYYQNAFQVFPLQKAKVLKQYPQCLLSQIPWHEDSE